MCYIPNLCAIFLISQLYCEQIIKLHNINLNYMPNLCVICLTYVSYFSYHNDIVNHHPVLSSLHIITLIKIVKVCFDLIPVTGFCSPIV